MLQVRLGEHHRHAFLLEPGHDLGEALGERRRHALERLVEEKELCAAHQRARERGELSLRDWWNSIKAAKAFALFAWDDPLPFLVERKFGLSYGRILAYVAKDLLKRLRFPRGPAMPKTRPA